jgi:uncharacterized protein
VQKQGPGQEQEQEDRAAFLERVRRSGISIDREGRFWHEGEMVRHEGLRQALFRWLDRLPLDPPGPDAGRHILRLDAQRFAYVDVADTPLVATSLRWEAAGADERALLGLTDGSEVPLDPTTLTVDDAGTLRCQVRPNGVEARLATSAAATLAERIETRPDGPQLQIAGRVQPLRPR